MRVHFVPRARQEQEVPNSMRTARVLWSRPQDAATNAAGNSCTRPESFGKNGQPGTGRLPTDLEAISMPDTRNSCNAVYAADDSYDRDLPRSSPSSTEESNKFEMREQYLAEYSNRLLAPRVKATDEIDAMLLELRRSSTPSIDGNSSYANRSMCYLNPLEKVSTLQRVRYIQGFTASHIPNVSEAAIAPRRF